jgi:glutamate dehydrogenase
VKPDDAKAALVEKTVELLHEKLADGRGVELERFVRRYYAGIAAEDVLERSVLELYGAALAHWNTAARRRPGETKVHVYNPRFEEHGWQSPHTVVELVVDDMPFLVDSVAMALTRRGSAIHFLAHPVVAVNRDAEGQLIGLADDAADATAVEAFLHVEADRQTEPRLLAELQDELLRVLADVRSAVDDWPAMRQRARELEAELAERPPPVDPQDVAETRAFLGWLDDGHFTFLGYRDYELGSEGGETFTAPVAGSGLGILRGGHTGPGSRRRLAPEVLQHVAARELLNLSRANSRATVHRASFLDYVGLRRLGADGHVVGERRFLGLYTHSAYSASVFEIPVVRRKVQQTLDGSGFTPGSHDWKFLVDVLETFPREELFQISSDELREIALGVVRLGERPRVRLFVRPDPFGRFLSCLVYLPRDRYDTRSRLLVQHILEQAFGGVVLDYTARVSESVLARLHIVVATDEGVPEYDVAEIERQLVDATRAWTDDLRDALVSELGEERGVALFRRFGEAFPAAYREDCHARAAVADVERIERLASESDLGMSLYAPLESEPGFLRLKLLRAGGRIVLSDVLPLLENMGVRVVDERPYEIVPADGDPVSIYDFGLSCRDGVELEGERVRELFQDALARVWSGEAESDGFNRLVLEAGLHWREIVVLRAITKYLRQAGSTFSQTYVEETLAANPGIARLLVELFHARFTPDRGAGDDARAAELPREIEAALDAVPSLDEDRILRSMLHVVAAMLRTNYFQLGPDGRPKSYLSFKLDPQLVPDLPAPRPQYEIFVYAPRMEGVHLRGGRVARGGIRWSDRREDFRIEVLGLMKAQMVKNAVIVPVGAKGGFVVKQPPADRDALQVEVVACYRTLIRGLLDLTDNRVGEEIVPPPDVVRYDGDDAYLVVAADKGTATFSDIANELAAEYGFWLGDAFASGGSAGYDHKAMAITARGAWVSVERHFRELGLDTDEPFTVVGIGDMSGDVFGNGMLRSRRIKLLGAFDHRHVFVDPDPDPERSFAERERLFRLPRSSWADYDPAVISPGGGVYPRSAKSIPLSPELRAALAVEAASLPPSELIRALLRAPVDLLWNGGIGTFVKSSDEAHADAGDRTSDAIRVDAGELRCRVVGEGGNLGFTQRGRVEYALGGGRIYTDAIDNSAGVDCSDHEVNIKIALDAIVREGDLTEKQRNALLAEMADEVAELVLRDNDEQTRAISAAAAEADATADVDARLIRTLEQTGLLVRELEFLPGDETLQERAKAGGGLTAPELAILLSYAKIFLFDGILGTDVPEDPYFAVELARYFPAPLRERFADRIGSHRLRREIVASRVVNDMVARAGSTFAFRLADETGAAVGDVARAYTAAREIFGLREVWSEVEALDGVVPAAVQLALLRRTRVLVERAAHWLLQHRRASFDVAATIERYRPGAEELARAVASLIAPSNRRATQRAVDGFVAAGVPRELGARVAHLGALFPALDVADIAAAEDAPIQAVAETYFVLGTELDLQWLRERVTALPRETRWASLAAIALRDDLNADQAALTAEVVRNGRRDLPVAERVRAWRAACAVSVDRSLQVIEEVRASGAADLATLSVAVREVRNMIEASAAAATAQA